MLKRRVKAVCVCVPRGVLITWRGLAIVAGSLLLVNLLRELNDHSVSAPHLPLGIPQQTDMKLSQKIQSSTVNVRIDGYNRADWTRRACSSNMTPHHVKAGKITVRVGTGSKSMICPTYKIGSTFWRRIFTTISDPRYNGLVNPYGVPFDREFSSSLTDADNTSSQFDFKFTFVREPYVRLHSLYVDKLLAPNPYFWKVLGSKVIRFNRHFIKSVKGKVCSNDATFPEFIKYVIHCLETIKDVDPHFVPMETNCLPCQVNYTFIGSMESFAADSDIVLRRMGLTETAELLQRNGSVLAAEDAIRDTLKQPFAFKKRYQSCMTLIAAIQLAWNKLKLRGLIGDDRLALSATNVTLYKHEDVVQLALASRARSTKQSRKKLSTKIFYDNWSSIAKSDLEKIPILYASDFYLFKYDPYPKSIFNMSRAEV